MSEKRKDNKGRILRTGESQRKDLIYQYRYTDIRGKRQTVYSSDLKELREKEKEIQKQLDDGIDYAAGKINVIQLLERYISIKQGVRYNTKVGYNFVLNLVKKEDFGYRSIRDIKVSDAQKWIMKLHEDGKGYSTLTSVRGVVKPAFQMAYNEDVIRRNPFDFKLVDVVSNDSQKRIAMTEEQQTLWMDFIRTDKTYCKYYDEFVVLLGTGMRVSDDDDKIRLNQRKPSKYKGLSRFGPEKNLQRINKFMKERPTFYKKLIQMKENFRFYLRCFYCITKVMILQFNSENRTELARNG